MRSWIVATLACLGCGNDKPANPPPPKPAERPTQTLPPAPAVSRVTPIPLPGAGSDGIALDYVTFDPHTNTVWAPIGNGSVDVVDTETRKVRKIDGFPAKRVEAMATRPDRRRCRGARSAMSARAPLPSATASCSSATAQTSRCVPSPSAR